MTDVNLCTIGSVKIICSPLLLIIIPAAVAMGMAGLVFIIFISLTLHELSHVFVANGLGFEVESIEIQPFGFIARIKGSGMSFGAEFVVAAAGPLCSIIIGISLLAAKQVFPAASPDLNEAAVINLALAGINLLPALPLDGGSMLKAALSLLFKPRFAALTAIWLGIAASAAITGLGILSIINEQANYYALIIGGFLMTASIKEFKNLDSTRLNAMLKRTYKLHRGAGLKLYGVALNKNTTALDALRLIKSSAVNIIAVMDDETHILFWIDEGTLFDCITRFGTGIKLGNIRD